MTWIPGQNPRSDPRHRERGPRRYTYTAYDVAELAGRSVSTVRQSGIDLSSLREVVEYIALVTSKRNRSSRRVTSK